MYVEVKLMKDMEDPKDKPLTLDTRVTHQSDPTVRSLSYQPQEIAAVVCVLSQLQIMKVPNASGQDP